MTTDKTYSKRLTCNWFSILIIIFIWIAGCLELQAQTPAFPTAEGYGMYASGGRGGLVVEVTTIEDSPTNPPVGSLRWAFQQGKEIVNVNGINFTTFRPITIVFRVSGIIDLKGNDLRMKRNNVTLAGQTAPGDGICIRGGKVNFGGSENLIIRHLRFRMGLASDSSFIEGGALGIENAKNFIIDHCSFGWSGEENMTIYDNKMTTIQWCIVHEGLYASGHSKGARSYACQWGGETATYHHNLLAHHVSRTPRFNGSRGADVTVRYDYVNNVNYNWGKDNSPYGAYISIPNGSWSANIVNNYYKPGPARPGTSSSFFVQSSYGSTMGNTLIAKWHMSGNYMEGTANSEKNTDNYLGLDAGGYLPNGVTKSMLIEEMPFDMPYKVATETAHDAYNSVLAKVGAFPRDTVDRRIIHEVSTGTATGKGTSERYMNKDGLDYSNNSYYGVAKGIIDNPVLAFGLDASYPEYLTYNTITDNDKDGMDDAWELANGLDPTDPADRNKVTKSGYTALEVYLNSLVGEKIELDFSGVSSSQFIHEKPKVFFNPSTKQLIIQGEQPVLSGMIFDTNGRRIFNFNNLSLQHIEMPNLPTGVFFVHLRMQDNRIERVKIVNPYR